MSRSSLLLAAMENRQLTRIVRRFEATPVRGYVMAVGPRFFLIALVSDRLWFDGFECLRITDVLSVQEDPYARFAESALKKRGQRRPKKPKVDVSSIESILRTADRAFPLVTIAMEKQDADVCYIGKVVGMTDRKLALRGIDPHARWHAEPDDHLLGQITRVCFGGDYEDALFLVGGKPGD